jgi:hypothetical protein
VRSPVVVIILLSLLATCTPAASPAAFTVSDLTVASGQDAILMGADVAVSARVQNTGEVAGTYEAELSVDGAVQAHQDVAIEGGQSALLRFTLQAGSPGDHEVALGSLTADLHVTATADFVVSGLRLADAATEVLAGDVVEVVAEVENVGALAGTYEAMLTVDGTVEARQQVGLEIGQARTLRFDVTAGPPGDHVLEIGGATTTLSVLEPAAVEVTALELTPNPAETGGKLTAAVTVTNAGGATGTVVVKVLVDDKAVAKQEVTVEGGQQATVDVPFKVPAAGWHTVAAGPLEDKLLVWKITRPATGTAITNKIKGGRGQLTIENGNDRDAVLLLAKSSAPTKAVLAVYLRAGRSATIKNIKDGTYVVFFSLGKRWDSRTKAFTNEVDRSRFQDTIRFKTTRTATMITWSTWTLTLQAVVGGTAPTQDVGEGDFPGVP